MMKCLRLLMAVACFSVLLLTAEPRAQSLSNREITVSAAISLKDAFEEISRLFKQTQPAARVVFNFAGSGDLARQIEAGAPVDVFASAAQKDLDDVERKNLIAPNSRKNFANNMMSS